MTQVERRLRSLIHSALTTRASVIRYPGAAGAGTGWSGDADEVVVVPERLGVMVGSAFSRVVVAWTAWRGVVVIGSPSRS